MFGDFNLEDFFIFINCKSCSIRSLLIIYINMFNLLKSGVSDQACTVENRADDVDSTSFLRFKSIGVYCYR